MLWIDDKLLTVHTKGIDCPRINTTKRYVSLEVEDLVEVSAYGWSVSAKRASVGHQLETVDDMD